MIGSSILYIVAGTFVMYLLFKFAKNLFYKVLIILLLFCTAIYGLYYFKVGPFIENVAHIDVIRERECFKKNTDITCECIVKLLEKDISSRFNKSEIEKMKDDRSQSAYVFQKSMSAISNQAKECLKNKGQENLWRAFIKSTLQLDNSLVNGIENLIEKGKTNFDEKLNHTQCVKDNIDNKYSR